ncbi:hypothetical protein MRB53_037613 [Persea americana]|nr:hypothetical protein MRB53_037613 [Persea americana]
MLVADGQVTKSNKPATPFSDNLAEVEKVFGYSETQVRSAIELDCARNDAVHNSIMDKVEALEWHDVAEEIWRAEQYWRKADDSRTEFVEAAGSTISLAIEKFKSRYFTKIDKTAGTNVFTYKLSAYAESLGQGKEDAKVEKAGAARRRMLDTGKRE